MTGAATTGREDEFPYAGARQQAAYVQATFDWLAAGVRRDMLERARYKFALEKLGRFYRVSEPCDHVRGEPHPNCPACLVREALA